VPNPIPKSLQLGRYAKGDRRRGGHKGPEGQLEEMCENYLEVLRLRYIRIPDSAYFHLFGPQSKIPPWIQKLLSKALKGVPDLLIFAPHKDTPLPCVEARALCIELKVGKGKQSQGQLEWARDVPVHVVRSFDEFKELVDDFNR